MMITVMKILRGENHPLSRGHGAVVILADPDDLHLAILRVLERGEPAAIVTWNNRSH